MDMSTEHEFVHRVLDASLCGIYVYSVVHGHNEYTNSRYTEITGWTLDEINAMLAGEFAELFHPDDRDQVFAHMAEVMDTLDGAYVEIEYRFRTKDGRWIWCLSRDAPFERAADGTVSSFIGTFLDITQRRQQEEHRKEFEHRIQQTQRIESLGILAGGIAHDFNNILMGIMGHADLAQEEMSPLSPARESLCEIVAASKRAAELCGQMLAYAGKGRVEQRDFSLRDLIEETLKMLKTCITKKAILNLNLEKELPCIHGDPPQIRQILMNLVINASDAIGERSGTVTISTGATECSEEYLANGYIVAPGAPGIYVYVEVSDTGCGMDKKTVERIFEPFYTTKFTGRGLGLSAVMGIVNAHKGALRVYSEPGKGTSFKVLFPAVEASGEGDRADVAGSAWRGSGTVLLTDDEETVRTISSMQLRRLGFEVLTAQDGRQAVDLYRKRSGEIALVLLDLTMPHMDGEEAYRELRQINPDVRVILASGYSESDIASRFAGKGLAGCLQKPYTLAKLRSLLSSVMPEAEPSEASKEDAGPNK